MVEHSPQILAGEEKGHHYQQQQHQQKLGINVRLAANNSKKQFPEASNELEIGFHRRERRCDIASSFTFHCSKVSICLEMVEDFPKASLGTIPNKAQNADFSHLAEGIGRCVRVCVFCCVCVFWGVGFFFFFYQDP